LNRGYCNQKFDKSDVVLTTQLEPLENGTQEETAEHMNQFLHSHRPQAPLQGNFKNYDQTYLI